MWKRYLRSYAKSMPYRVRILQTGQIVLYCIVSNKVTIGKFK